MNPQDHHILSEISFVAFDLETTGMDPISDQILEIGALVFQKESIVETFQCLINPGIPIPPMTMAIHGIDDSMVADKPRLSEVLSDFFAVYSKGVPLAHNALFDLSFLLEGARQNALSFLEGPVVDSCVLARMIFRDLPSYRLGALVEKFGIEREKAHRALEDAKSCLRLFGRAVQELPKKWETSWGEFRTLFSSIVDLDLNLAGLPEGMSSLKEAVQRGQRLTLSYRDGHGEVTKRGVTPVGFIRDAKQRPLMVGYCHLRQATRTFRLDRILEIETD